MNIARNIHTIMKQDAQRKDMFHFKTVSAAGRRIDEALPGKPFIV